MSVQDGEKHWNYNTNINVWIGRNKENIPNILNNVAIFTTQ